jgi:polyvinyl alcohol dehydrogenase (cytochrome)
MTQARRHLCAFALLLVALATTARGSAATIDGCAPARAGGEWRSYSHDLANSRHQPEETTITPATGAALAKQWVFSTAATGLTGSFNTTPAVADGCVFLNGGTGIFAINADTGALVWKTALSGAAGSPSVTNGKVYVNVSGSPGGAAALDEATGDIVWQTIWSDPYPGADAESSAVVFDGMVLSTMSLAGAELSANRDVRGQYALLDADSGALLYKGYSIPNEDFATGSLGGGLWATPAVDTETGYAYEGTGNPYSKEHRYTNAILKIDVDRARATFGQIVGYFHGTVDTYVGDGTKPGCETVPNVATCEFDDLDFGASPQLFADAGGRKLVGDLQKSGIYHAADAATMHPVWSAVVGLPAQPAAIFQGPASTASFDGHKLYVASDYPALLQSVDRSGAGPGWSHALASATHYEPVTTAGGLAYTIDGTGVLHVVDCANGNTVALKVLSQDVGEVEQNALGAPGVAVARNTVYVPIAGVLVAYR